MIATGYLLYSVIQRGLMSFMIGIVRSVWIQDPTSECQLQCSSYKNECGEEIMKGINGQPL